MSIKHHFHGCQKRRWYVLRLLSGAISSTWLYLYLYLLAIACLQATCNVIRTTTNQRRGRLGCIAICHVTDVVQCWANSEDRAATHVPRPPSSSSRQRSSKHWSGLAHSLSSPAAGAAVCHLSLDVQGQSLTVALSASSSSWQLPSTP